ncbi:MAG: hypothetical protein ACTSPH_05970 [Promethearchaeota archaeon]
MRTKIKRFYKKDGGVVQLIDKEKMKNWPIELPLIFIEYVRNNLIKTYNDPKVQKEVEKYLNEILEDIAIPRLINVLKEDISDEILTALERIEELAKKKIEMIMPIKPYLDDLLKNKDKRIRELSKNIYELFNKAEKRKLLAEKRKIMQQKEREFLEGKISNEEYAKIRKEYLLLRED